MEAPLTRSFSPAGSEYDDYPGAVTFSLPYEGSFAIWSIALPPVTEKVASFVRDIFIAYTFKRLLNTKTPLHAFPRVSWALSTIGNVATLAFAAIACFRLGSKDSTI